MTLRKHRSGRKWEIHKESSYEVTSEDRKEMVSQEEARLERVEVRVLPVGLAHP